MKRAISEIAEMDEIFTRNQMFEIAIQVERNGIAFYEKAAHTDALVDVRIELLELAEMEKEHIETFRELREVSLHPDEVRLWNDPKYPAAQYVRHFARGKVFDLTEDLCQHLTPEATREELLRFAIDRERDTIALFTGLGTTMSSSYGCNRKVEKIIKEEMAHVNLLAADLARIKRKS